MKRRQKTKLRSMLIQSTYDMYQKQYKRNINGTKVEVKEGRIYFNDIVHDIQGYTINKIIGGGANGIIFESLEDMTNRKVAIKIWIPDPTKNKSNVTRSREEIIKLSRFNSDDIVRMYYFNVVNQYTYCVMEYIDGSTLRDYLRLHKPAISERYMLAMNIIDTLEKCHNKGIYHGDLHLDNIMVTKQGEVKILDFGTSIFTGEVYSKQRDSKLIGETLLALLGKNVVNLLELYGLEFKDYSPECVRLMMKALFKVVVLLGFGLTETVVHDLALFAVMVPFFNVGLIEVMLQRQVIKEEDRCYIELFRRTVVLELLGRHPKAKFDDESISDSEIFRVYTEWKDYFIERVESGCSIYFALDDSELFNGELFSKYRSNLSM